MAKTTEITATIYSTQSDRDLDKLEYVLGELLHAIYPKVLTHTFDTQLPDGAHENLLIIVRGPLNTETQRMMQDVLKHTLGYPYEIGYTKEDSKISRKAEIQMVFNRLSYTNIAEAALDAREAAVFGPITKRSADKLAAARAEDNARILRESDEETARLTEEDETRRFNDGIYAD